MRYEVTPNKTPVSLLSYRLTTQLPMKNDVLFHVAFLDPCFRPQAQLGKDFQFRSRVSKRVYESRGMS